MAEPVIITWTPQNWITVVLMVALVFFGIGAGVKIMQQRQQMKAAA